MKVEHTICDICKRNYNKVNTEQKSGHGSITFRWSMGGNSGGASDTIHYEDICVECTEKIRYELKQVIGRIKKRK